MTLHAFVCLKISEQPWVKFKYLYKNKWILIDSNLTLAYKNKLQFFFRSNHHLQNYKLLITPKSQVPINKNIKIKT